MSTETSKTGTDRNRLYLILLGIFLVLYVLSNVIWLTRDLQFPSDDFADHLKRAFSFYSDLRSGELPRFLLPTGEYYPPITYQVTSFFFLIFGPGINKAILSQSFFMIILVFSVYYIGRELWNEEAGFLGAIASLCFPYMTMATHFYLLDFPCAAMTALSILLLYKSRFFTDKRMTLLFFVASALAILTKWTFLFYITTPFIFCLVVFIRDIFKEKESPWINLLLLAIVAGVAGFGYFYSIGKLPRPGNPMQSFVPAYLIPISPVIVLFVGSFFLPKKFGKIKPVVQGALLFFIISGLFYLPNFQFILNQFKHALAEGIEEGDTYSPVIYLKLFVIYFQGLPLTIMTLVGIGWYFIKGERSTHRLIHVLGVVTPLLILFMSSNKDIRYFTPIVTFTAPLALFWITRISLKPLKYTLIGLFGIFAFLGWLGWLIPISSLDTYNVRREHTHFIVASGPDTRPWNMDKISKALGKSLKDKDRIVLFTATGFMAGKISPAILPLLTQAETGKDLQSLNRIGNEQGQYMSPDMRYKFFITRPRRVEDSSYDKLITVYFYEDQNKNSLPPTPALKVEKVLRDAGMSGEGILLETIELPENHKVVIIESSIEQPKSYQDFFQR